MTAPASTLPPGLLASWLPRAVDAHAIVAVTDAAGVIRYAKRAKIEVFIKLVEEDLSKGILPCKNLRDARAYLKDMVGKPITSANHK